MKYGPIMLIHNVLFIFLGGTKGGRIFFFLLNFYSFFGVQKCMEMNCKWVQAVRHLDEFIWMKS